MLKTILIFTFALFFFSCNNENPTKQKSNTSKTENQDENENDSDTLLTSEELFSSALVQDVLGEDDDVDLQFYIEEQIYPIVSKSNKVTLDRVSSSLYLLSYDEGGTVKNILIQKFYNPEKDEFVFEKSETQTNATKQFVK